MAREKAPAFQFYTKDWDTDVNVIPMTYEEEGVYWAICRLVWNEKLVPSNLDELRLLLKGKPSLRVMQTWWIRIGKCFTARTDRNGFLFHKRIESERRKQAARRKTQRQNGLKGGRPKATANPRVSHAALSGNRKQSSSSSSSSSSADLRKIPPKPARWAGRLDPLSEDVRVVLAAVVASIPSEARATATRFHVAIDEALVARGWVTEREVRVTDRGDGRAGYLDLVATAPERIAFEFDRNTARQKSLEKLTSAEQDGFRGVVICRSPSREGWRESGSIWVWGLPPLDRSTTEALRRLPRPSTSEHDAITQQIELRGRRDQMRTDGLSPAEIDAIFEREYDERFAAKSLA